MSDYISRQDAINVAQNYHCSHDITIIPNTDYSRGFYDGLAIRENDILQGLSELKPSADVAPVMHAYWIPQKENHEFKEAWMKCSACGYPVSMWTGNTNFCPNCGAKMDREE